MHAGSMPPGYSFAPPQPHPAFAQRAPFNAPLVVLPPPRTGIGPVTITIIILLALVLLGIAACGAIAFLVAATRSPG